MHNRNETEITTRFILSVSFLVLVLNAYLSLFTQTEKGNTVAELVSFTLQRMEAKLCFLSSD